MKKRLLIASDTFLPRWDGITRFLLEIVPKLSLKYDITLAVPDFKGRSVKIKNVNIVRVPVHDFVVDDMHLPKFKFGMMKNLVKESDIVFIQAMGPIGLLAARYADKLKKPLYAYTHIIEWDLYPKVVGKFKSFVKWLTLAISRHFYNKCDFIFVPSADIEKVLIYSKITPQKKVISLGVNENEFRPPKSKESAKKAVRIRPTDVVIGFVGRIGWEKDLPTLYRAFDMLNRKYGGMLRLLVVGSGISLDRMFKSLENVIHIEATEKVVKYLQAMDIFVMPSLAETSSLATMEAMACGLPVVATTVGCIPHYVEDGKNGYLFPPKDAAVIAKKLSKLIDRPDLRKAIGSMARKTVSNKYNWNQTIKEISEMLG
ncbi:MAG: glycosyltransferase family 4 protein [Nanoarchaeota archaeon]|nr:glycosyltransferase family 4 protein [Nanoarchaeota archaeon]